MRRGRISNWSLPDGRRRHRARRRFIGRLPTNFTISNFNFKFQPAVFLQLVLFVVLALALASRAAAEVAVALLPAASSRSPSTPNGATAGRRASTRSGCSAATARFGRAKFCPRPRGRAVDPTDRADRPATQRGDRLPRRQRGSRSAAGRTGRGRLTDQTWCGQFETSAGVGVQAAAIYGKPDLLPPIYQRGMQRRSPDGERRPPGEGALPAARNRDRPPATPNARSNGRPRSPARNRCRQPAPTRRRRWEVLDRRPRRPGPTAVRVAGDRRSRLCTGARRPRGRGARRHAANPRLSPQRRAGAGPMVSRSEQPPVDRGDRFGRERGRRRARRASRRSTFRPIGW